MLIIFIDIKGLNYYKFIPTGGTVNQTYYIKFQNKIKKYIDLCTQKRIIRVEFLNTVSHYYKK
jgi:hypothetical protein